MPQLYTIPFHQPFAETLAAWLLEQVGDDPLALSDVTLLLPNRRSARAMQDAFLKLSGGKPLLLPTMRGIGDVEEDELFSAPSSLPPAISPLQRQMMLAEMIQGWYTRNPHHQPVNSEQAMRLAYDFASFLDEMQRFEIPPERLNNLVPSELAEHWQDTLDFFKLILTDYPHRLRQLGLMDPILRRNALQDAQCAAWQHHPPAHWVIAAGTTGSTPATFRLLKAILSLPKGAIFLPGFDPSLPEEDITRAEPHHPHYAMLHLLKALKITPHDINILDDGQPSTPNRQRTALLQAAMRPTLTPVDAPFSTPPILTVPTLRQEAESIALMLRTTLETPGKTAALVTPDRELASRVATLMQRWEVNINDSAGQPLTSSPAVAFLLLVLRMCHTKLSPMPLLAALKHPLAAGGIEKAAFRAQVRHMERKHFRGVRTESINFPFNDNYVSEKIKAFCEIMCQKERASIRDLLAAHLACAEALATSDIVPGKEALWGSPEGAQALALLSELQSLPNAATLPPQDYPGWFEALWLGRTSRPRYGTHPRLAILSPMEARLQHYDLMILGELNEGVWPASRTSIWMNQHMREQLGLPVDNFYTGLAARDFLEIAGAPEVIFTRAEKRGSTATLPSPWLLRLLTILPDTTDLSPSEPWHSWSTSLHTPDYSALLAPPAPTPPLTSRPQDYYVTHIERWMQDPYGYYARYILKLKKLDAIDEEPGDKDFGNLMHRILERYKKLGRPPVTYQDALQQLKAIGTEEFEKFRHFPGVMQAWYPRFEVIAEWFIAQEWEQKDSIASTMPELKGRMAFASGSISAKPDRIDTMKDGTLRLIDYKTGTPPSATNVARGMYSQLTLAALIAEADGFEGINAAEVSALEYWRISATSAERRSILSSRDKERTLEDAKQEAREGLNALLQYFSQENSAYLACPNPHFAPNYNDYDHLERLSEWRVADAGE